MTRFVVELSALAWLSDRAASTPLPPPGYVHTGDVTGAGQPSPASAAHHRDSATSYTGAMDGFELSAAIALWRGPELLLMKREARGFGGGGWFLPGGHVEGSERPAAAAIRELWEETALVIPQEALALADVMSYQHGEATAHTLIYNAICPEGAEPVLNGEHVVARWYAPEAACARFFDAEMLRGRSLSEPNIALAAEVARVIRSAARARGMETAIDPATKAAVR